MKKEFYTAKDIILGTRNEYQVIEGYLNTLRDMVYSDDRQVKDFYFTFRKTLEANPRVICNFIQNEKTLRGLIWYLKKKLGMHYYAVEQGFVSKNINEKYNLGNAYYNATIKENAEKDFDLLVQKILESDFAKYMNINQLSNPDDKDTFMSIYSSGIEVCYNNSNGYQNKENERLAHINYLAKHDCIIAHDYDRELDNEMLYHLLNFPVPKSELSDYHISLIENAPIVTKPIEICTLDLDENIDKNKFKLQIHEHSDRVIFTKTKIRKR